MSSAVTKGSPLVRIGLLTQWYDPEPGPAALPGILARGLAARGHQVQVVTGFPNYPTGRVAPGYHVQGRLDEQLQGVDVRRVALYPNHDASPSRRLLNYTSFGASAAVLGASAFRQFDALWVNYSPITVAWPMWVARYALGVPTVVHVLDLWPDTLLVSGLSDKSRFLKTATRPLHAWCSGMYQAAHAVAFISPSVGSVLHERGVASEKLHYVPMWADEDVFRPSALDLRSRFGLTNENIVLLYAGALGEAQGLGTLLEACARVRDPRFVALIAGSGTAEARLRLRAVELGATRVRFIGRVPQQDMTRLMATADLSYVGLRTHALSAITMPSKTQAALAAGKALLVAAEGDVARVGTESGAALLAHPDDPAGIASAIVEACVLGRPGLAELGERARRYYEQTFSTRHGVDAIEALLIEAATTSMAAA